MKGKKALHELELDRLIHERARLMILTRLASSEEGETGFTELRDGLALSAGNLSVQLKTLEEAGYVEISKRFKDNKPWTGVTLTPTGRRAIEAYVSELESIVASLRGVAAGGESAAKE